MELLEGLCRFCTQKLDPSLSKNIFEPENCHLLKTAKLCISAPMLADDQYPKLACIHCVFKINVITEFQDMGLSAFKVFDEILSKGEIETHREIKVEELSDLDIEEIKLEQTGRKRIRQVENWQKNVAKTQKGLGKSYKSFGKTRDFVPAKEMGPPCGEKCRLKCVQKISKEKRRDLFEMFWALGNTELQRNFLALSLRVVTPKYRYRTEGSTRMFNNAFYFTLNDSAVRVCKIFFKNTLGVTDRMLRTVVKMKTSFKFKETRGKHGKHRTVPTAIKNSIREHIHQSRTDSKNESRTIKSLHKDYQDECKAAGVAFGNYLLYNKIFNQEFS